MRHNGMRRISIIVALAVIWWLPVPRSAAAVEQVREFLQLLQDQGMYDLALDYLEEMKASPLAPEEFKKNILFEQGLLMINSARAERDSKQREKLFNDARESLEAFAKQNAGTLLAAKANSELADVLVERGRIAVLRAEQPANANEKDAILTEARKHFADARTVFEESHKYYSTEWAKFPKAIPMNVPMFQARQDVRAEMVQAEVKIATTAFEDARTYAPTSKEGKEKLTAAATQFGKLYNDYRTWIAGLYARLYQGRCLQELKDYKTAVSYYEDLISQDPKQPAFRILIAKTYVQLAECLEAQKDFQQLIDRCTEWYRDARPTEEKSLDWIALGFRLANAHYQLSVAQKDKGIAQRHVKESRDLITRIARIPGEFQKPAGVLLGKVGRASDTNKSGRAATFDEAFDKAKDALTAMNNSEVLMPALERNDPEGAKEVKKQIEENRQIAFDSFQEALGLVNDKVDIVKLNFARYYLCYLYWQRERLYDAAVLGEFLARHYPDSEGARPGAKIAMAAYLRNYNNPKNPSRDFDADRVVAIADFITKRWPDSAESDDAYNMLVSFKVQQRSNVEDDLATQLKNVEEAAGYLSKFSKGYPGRPQAELKVGQALWSQYLRCLRAPEEERPAAAAMESIKNKAQETLEDGIKQMEEEEITLTTTAAMLSLAQIYLDTTQYDKAVATLEHEKLGPLVLVKAGHKAALREGYSEEVYKTALRSYVSMVPPQTEKADGVMKDLEDLSKANGDAKAAERLTAIFIGLGMQLGQQIEDLREQGKTKEVEALAKSFESFLDRIGAQKQGNSWASLNWVASTYYNLGKGFDDGGKKTKGKGKADVYYAKAAATYERIVKDVESKKLVAPSDEALLNLQMRLAECQRNMGDFKASLDMLGIVLQKKPMMLEAQKEAALTYQLRGDREKSLWYDYALKGGNKDPVTGQNRIWGWGKLATVAMKHKQHQDVFYEARYNLALTRFHAAKKQAKPEDRKKVAETARDDIERVAILYPTLGGEKWYSKFDRLMKDIQKELGEKKPGGLKQFAQRGSSQPKSGQTTPAAQRNAETKSPKPDKGAHFLPLPSGERRPATSSLRARASEPRTVETGVGNYPLAQLTIRSFDLAAN